MCFENFIYFFQITETSTSSLKLGTPYIIRCAVNATQLYALSTIVYQTRATVGVTTQKAQSDNHPPFQEAPVWGAVLIYFFILKIIASMG